MKVITESEIDEIIKETGKAESPSFLIALHTVKNRCKEINQWQPIETAPKDRRVLLFFIKGKCTVTGNLHEDQDKSNYSHWQELPEDPEMNNTKITKLIPMNKTPYGEQILCWNGNYWELRIFHPETNVNCDNYKKLKGWIPIPEYKE